MSIEAMKQALDALQGSGYYDTTQQREAITALRQAIKEAALQKLTDIHQEIEAEKQEPVAWWNPDESGLSFKQLRGDWQPLYAAPVHTIDISQERVDETVKNKHEPVAEIVCEDMGRPFNAMKIRTHFFKEVPAVGTKLYTAPPKQEPDVYGDGNVYRGVRSKDSQTKTLYCKAGECDWCMLEATQESLREHMAEIKRLRAELEQAEKVEHDLTDVRCECCGYMTYHREHMGCIKAAYKQAEKQEPVAYRYRVMSGMSSAPCWTFALPQPEAILETQPLYTALPRREWVGMTDAEAWEEWVKAVDSSNHSDRLLAFRYLRAIEAKLREKNT